MRMSNVSRGSCESLLAPLFCSCRAHVPRSILELAEQSRKYPPTSFVWPTSLARTECAVDPSARKAAPPLRVQWTHPFLLGPTSTRRNISFRASFPFHRRTLILQGVDGATTVASTSYLASLAGVKVFVTGGVGGVHRGAESTFDVSADLSELAQTPVVVVCAGIKSILDIEKTLEVRGGCGVVSCLSAVLWFLSRTLWIEHSSVQGTRVLHAPECSDVIIYPVFGCRGIAPFFATPASPKKRRRVSFSFSGSPATNLASAGLGDERSASNLLRYRRIPGVFQPV